MGKKEYERKKEREKGDGENGGGEEALECRGRLKKEGGARVEEGTWKRQYMIWVWGGSEPCPFV